jgi:hypothetical protein
MTYDIAVQPKAFETFDAHGCEWAKDMAHAYTLAAAMGEDAVIWKCPHQGNPMAWVSVKAEEAGIEAIASLLFD